MEAAGGLPLESGHADWLVSLAVKNRAIKGAEHSNRRRRFAPHGSHPTASVFVHSPAIALCLCPPLQRGNEMEAAGGFEPPNNGFANRRLRPLGYAAAEDPAGRAIVSRRILSVDVTAGGATGENLHERPAVSKDGSFLKSAVR